ncbi:MAG: hypothetical protein PW786_08020 [Arachidicoccus sp.]|nr:hypothetical protein [Arachidicoccus sp.]
MITKRNLLKTIIPTIFPLCIFAQNKDASIANAIELTINQNEPGIKISNDFPGFSYEAGLLASSPDYLNENNTKLIRMIKNLGNGILRIGGNSSDITHWREHDKYTSPGKDSSLFKSDIDIFSKFAKATGWKVIFGLNLGDNNIDAAINEAKYVNNKLENEVYVYQIGNEPDLYYKWLRPKTYDSTGFLKDWNTYYISLKAALPSMKFAGPDVSHSIEWVDYFAANTGKNISLLDAHYYRKLGNHTATKWDYILNKDTLLNDYLNNLNETSGALSIPYRISECNSVSRGGKEGVSDVFASALWGLDFMWTVAEHNGQGVNFHGGTHSYYAPIVLKDGKPTPRPLYYAMLAFKYASENSKIIPLTINKTDNSNFSAFASTNDKNTYITLINKENKAKTFSIGIGGKASNYKVASLGAPSPTALEGITFGNNAVQDDGSFQLGNLQTFPVKGNKFSIEVPAMSASIIFVR